MDTIASIATAVGSAGIAVIRISGPDARDVLSRTFAPKNTKRALVPRMLTYGFAKDGQETIDECMAVYMPAPHTYTTENVAEIQCHGGRVTAQRVLEAVLKSGARLAEPGEFTKRAFLGGRIDLMQAEGVMELIGAKTERAAKSSLQQMGGYLSQRIHALQSSLLDTIAYIEAYLDYPDEDIEPLTTEKAAAETRAIEAELHDALKNARAGRMLTGGVKVVLAGSPNTGKSSLLNALLREQRAIVTDVAGTTRDVLREELNLNGLPVQLVDTAGLRASQDRVEQIGIDRARAEMRQADVVLLVVDSARELDAEEKELLLHDRRLPLVVALNKGDLPSVTTEITLRAIREELTIVKTSAKTNQGVDTLRQTLYDTAVGGASPEEAYLTSERHVQAAQNACAALERALLALQTATLDCAALDLRAAWEELGRITGENTTEDVVDRIFEKFCLGK